MPSSSLAHRRAMSIAFQLWLFMSAALVDVCRADVPYSCDPRTCVPPSCLCPSINPPGGLATVNTPQLVVISFDDAVTPFTSAAAHSILQHRNPNGCPIRGTFFTSHTFTDYHSVTRLAAEGHEIASHSVDHGHFSSAAQATTLRELLTRFARVPSSNIKGYRAPSLQLDPHLLHGIAKSGFEYDCSITEGATGVLSRGAGKAIWPYTLDRGVAQDCWISTCPPDNSTRTPGLWELPMYSFLDGAGEKAISAMDPVNPFDPDDDLFSILQRNFLFHYRGNRSPFGVWLHPAFLMGDPLRVDAVNRFVEWTMRNFTLGSVWYTTGSEVIDFMRRPAPIGAYQPAAGCTPRAVAARETVCDGLDDNGNGLVDEGLVTLCSYPTASFRMCGECPAQVPTFLEPQPPGAESPGSVARVASGASATQCAPIAGGCRGGVSNAAMCACECARVTWSADGATRLGGGFCADGSGLCTVARVPVSGAALFEALQQNSTFIAATSFYDIVRSSLFAPSFQKFLLPASMHQSLVPVLPSALAWSDAVWLCPAQAPAWLRGSDSPLRAFDHDHESTTTSVEMQYSPPWPVNGSSSESSAPLPPWMPVPFFPLDMFTAPPSASAAERDHDFRFGFLAFVQFVMAMSIQVWLATMAVF